MSSTKVLVEKSGPVVRVVINRPEVRNAVDAETAEALRDAFRAFDADDDAAVAVLGGAGGGFCAGYDLKSLAGAERLVDEYDPEAEGPMGPTRMLLRKPVIAAVDGYAVAGGLELALWCDLRVADEGATFGVFCRRWGVPLIDGGTVRLPRLVGMSRALDMILTGRAVGAAEALAWGLANRVVPNGQARGRQAGLRGRAVPAGLSSDGPVVRVPAVGPRARGGPPLRGPRGRDAAARGGPGRRRALRGGARPRGLVRADLMRLAPGAARVTLSVSSARRRARP